MASVWLWAVAIAHANGLDPARVVRNAVDAGARPVPGELLVEYRGEDLPRLARERGCELQRWIGRRPWARLRCAPERSPVQLVAEWAAAPGVAWVEHSFYVQPDLQPDDWTPPLWHLHNDGQLVDGSAGLPGADVDAFAAFEDSGARGQGVVVAILDSGVYPDHQDLVGRMAIHPGEDCGNGLDDDGNGYIDDCAGWDVGDDDPNADPTTGDPAVCSSWNLYHGTFIAGLIAAAGEDGVGSVGIAWDTAILPLKLIDDASCSVSSAAFVEAAAYAVDNGAHIMNMSFSSGAYSKLFEEVLQDSDAVGMLSALSAGNDGADLDTLIKYPKHYDFDNRLIVGNSTHIDRLSSSSNWGEVMVDLAAPGTDLRSADVDAPDDYRTGSGTSYSAPLVAASFAALWSAYPSLSAAEVRDAVVAGAEVIPAWDCSWTPWCLRSSARLDLPGALAEAARVAGSPRLVVEEASFNEVDGDGDGRPEPGEILRLDLDLANGGGSIATAVQVELLDPPLGLLAVEPVLDLGDLAAGGTLSTAAEPLGLELEVDPACVEERELRQPILLSAVEGSWTTEIRLRVACSEDWPELELVTVEVDDDAIQSSGDDDSVAESGEHIELNLDARNLGSVEAVGVQAWIQTADPYLDVTDAHVEIGSIPAGAIGGTTTSDHDFDIEIAPTCTEDFTARFEVLLEDSVGRRWSDEVELPIGCSDRATELEIASVELVDEDADGLLDANESAEIRLSLANHGLIEALDLSGELSTDATSLLIVDDALSLDELPPLSTITALSDSLAVASEFGCSTNGSVEIELALVDRWKREWSLPFEIEQHCLADEDLDGSDRPEDCDDKDAEVGPHATERCNGIDDDCDGELDEADAVDATSYYLDEDGDGAGQPGTGLTACEPPPSRVANDLDCDDADPAISPWAHELCNGVDDDCDGEVDAGAVDAPTWYTDEDGDGFGSSAYREASCEPPDGAVSIAGDCDDADAGRQHDCASMKDSGSDKAGGCAVAGVGALPGLWLLAAAAVARRRAPHLEVG